MNIMLKDTVSNLYNKENSTACRESKATDEKTEKDMIKETLEKIKEAAEKNGFKTEEEKKSYEDQLNQKIKSGAKLTPKEMSYLQRTNPMMYIRVKKVQMQREMLEQRLKQCRSKKEVEETHSQAVSGIHDKDPDKELVMNAYNDVTKEFKKTREYKRLPEDIKNKKNQQNKRKDEMMPTFNVKC